MKQIALFFIVFFLIATPEASLFAQSDEQESAKTAKHLNQHRRSEEESSKPTKIEIHGSGIQFGGEEIPTFVESVPRSKLQKSGASGLGDAVGDTVGVSSSSFGPGASRPIIRGQGGSRVRILENELSIGDISQTSDDHAVPYDPSSADLIEIIRGPGVLFYGGQAIGGVVNIVDGSIPQFHIGKAREGELEFTKGNQADDLISGRAMIQGEADNLNWHFSGFYSDTDNIAIPGFAESALYREREELERNTEQEEHEGEEHEGEEHSEEIGEEEQRGRLRDSAVTTKGFRSGFSIIEDDRVVGVGLKYFKTRYGVPGHMHSHGEQEEGEHDHEGEEGEEHGEEHVGEENIFEPNESLLAEEGDVGGGVAIDLEQVRLASKNHIDNPFSGFRRIDFSGALANYKHTEFESGASGTVFDSNSLNLRSELLHDVFDGFSGGFGSEVFYENFSAIGEEAFIPTTDSLIFSLFATEKYNITPNTALSAGVRYDLTNYDIQERADSSANFNALSFSTGAEQRFLEDYALSLNGTFSERAPNSTELYALGAHTATQSYEVGDPNLGKERSLGAELRLAKDRGRITAAVSTFVQYYSNYIGLFATGEEVEGLPEFVFRDEEARLWGNEIELGIGLLPTDFTHDLRLITQFDLVRGVVLGDDDQNLPRITPARSRVGLRHSWQNYESNLSAQFVEPQERVSDFELPTRGYVMLNADAKYGFSFNDNRYELFSYATNLLNQEARVHTSFLKDLAPLRGRAFFAGLRLYF
jgi:iron complex outermembrane recepter protein